MYMCMHVESEDVRDHLSGASLFLREGLSLACNSSSSLGWLTSKPQGITCLHLPVLGTASMHHHDTPSLFFFKMSSGDQTHVLMLTRQVFINSVIFPTLWDSWYQMPLWAPNYLHWSKQRRETGPGYPDSVATVVWEWKDSETEL